MFRGFTQLKRETFFFFHRYCSKKLNLLFSGIKTHLGLLPFEGRISRLPLSQVLDQAAPVHSVLHLWHRYAAFSLQNLEDTISVLFAALCISVFHSCHFGMPQWLQI